MEDEEKKRISEESISKLKDKILSTVIPHYISMHEDGSESLDNHAGDEVVSALTVTLIGVMQSLIEVINGPMEKEKVLKMVTVKFFQDAKDLIMNHMSFFESVEKVRKEKGKGI